MNNDLPNQDLLKEVFEDAAPPAFRAAVLRQALQEVHQRKCARRRNQALLAGLCILLTLAAAASFLPWSKSTTRPGPADALVVHSRLLDPALIIPTHPGIAAYVRPNPETSAIARVQTAPVANLVEIISDEQLLALLDGRPAALVYRNDAEADLIFLNPTDLNGFRLR